MVWTIAREIQAKMVKQDEWQDDIAQTAPVVMKTLAENIFARLPWVEIPLFAFFTVLGDLILFLQSLVFSITNFGVVDSILKPEYPVPGTSSSLKIINTYFCNIIFHLLKSLLLLLLQAYT
jgi:hypothetical protein